MQGNGHEFEPDVRDIIIAAGNILKRRFSEMPESREKERFELVSSVDEEIEAFLVERLRSLFGDVRIYSEEQGEIDACSETRWILDPIDGTANFIAGVPYFSVSVARELAGKITDGYVYNPISEEFYSAAAGSGTAYLNGVAIHPSQCAEIQQALVGLGFSANMANIQRYYFEWTELFDNCRKGLPLIVPSLTLCNVARGRLDAFIDFGCSMEGKAAASLILDEAGGCVRNYDLSPHDYRIKGVVACAPGLRAAIATSRA